MWNTRTRDQGFLGEPEHVNFSKEASFRVEHVPVVWSFDIRLIDSALGLDGAESDPNLMILETLLVLKVLVSREEDIKRCSCPSEEFSILDAGPAAVEDGLDNHPAEVTRQRPG